MKLWKALNDEIKKGRSYHMFCTLSGKKRVGKVVKFNCHTVWLKIYRGAKTYDVIKRKFVEHNVTWDFRQGVTRAKIIHTEPRGCPALD